MEIQRKIIESYNPPSNKEVWWFDKNEEVLKRCKNGAWVATASTSTPEVSDTPIEMSIYEIDKLAKEGKLIPGQIYCEPLYYARWNCETSIPSIEGETAPIRVIFESSEAHPLYLTAVTPSTFQLNARWGLSDCHFDLNQNSYQYNLVINNCTYNYNEKISKKEALKYGINFNQEIEDYETSQTLYINQVIGDNDTIYLFDKYALVCCGFEGYTYVLRYNFNTNNWTVEEYGYTLEDIQDTLPNKGKLYDIRSSIGYYRMAVSGTYQWEMSSTQILSNCSGTALLQVEGGCIIKADPAAGHCLLPIRMLGDESSQSAVSLVSVTVDENSTVLIPYDGTKPYYYNRYQNSHVGRNCTVILLSESKYRDSTSLISVGTSGWVSNTSQYFRYYQSIPTAGNIWTRLGERVEVCSNIFCSTCTDNNTEPYAISWASNTGHLTIKTNDNAIIGIILMSDDVDAKYEVECNADIFKQDLDGNYLVEGFEADSPFGSSLRVGILTAK